MNNPRPLLILALILMLLIPISTASEDEYTATFTSYYNSYGVWTNDPIEVNQSSGPQSIHGASGDTIEFKAYFSSPIAASFSLGSSIDDFIMQPSKTICLYDYSDTQCTDNASASKEGAIRLKLITLTKIDDSSSSSLPTTTSDNVIDIYLISTTGNELPLTKNGEDTYDVKSYGEEKGWSSQGSTESLQLIVEKIVSNPMSLTIITDGQYIEENTGDEDIRRFILKSNMPYEIHVEYTESASWGKDVDKLLTYKLNIKGLDALHQASSSSPTLSFPASYDVEIEKSKDLQLPSGTFTDSSVASIDKAGENDNGEIKWRITFHEVGMQELIYTLSNDEIVKVPFRILKAKDTTPADNTKSAQNPASGSSATIALAIISGLVLIIVLIFLTKRKGSSKRSSNTSVPDISKMG